MAKNLLKSLVFLLLLVSLFSCSRKHLNTGDRKAHVSNEINLQPEIPADQQPIALTELARTEEGGFVLTPGFYETTFKTYCLQPGTPDPSPRDAYFQGPVTGYRKDMIQTVLANSRSRSDIDQRNVQLLLWSIVSGANYNKLSPTIKTTANQLLTPKQLFELNGGVAGMVKAVSPSIASNNIFKGYQDVQKLFELGHSSYEAFERMAVLRQSSTISRHDIKPDRWYKQKGDYYVRYFPVSYQQVKFQVYVPGTSVDSSGKVNGEYLVFHPTGMQVIPVNSNAQRLGIGGPLLDIVKVVIQIEKRKEEGRKKKQAEPKLPPKGGA
jgi:hypothetical protein